MDACELKEHIINKDLIPNILEGIGCHGVKEYKKEYRCGLPEKTTTNSVAVNKTTLFTKVYTSESTVKGDIITLVMHIKGLSFINALKEVHKVLNIPFKIEYKKKEEKIDILNVFKKVKERNNGIYDYSFEEYDEDVLNRFIPIPHINFVRDGITIQTQKKFKIGYSAESLRISIPHYHWSSGRIIGVVGRTTIQNYKILDIAKYFPLTKPFYKSYNLYGLYENYKDIQESGIVIVFEGEKSVLKMDTFKYNNAVAVGCHDISEEQKRILIGLNVEIVIAFDTDIPLEHIENTCNMFKGIRKVSYIYDKYKILGEKMSPVDGGKKKFDYLFKYRTEY